MAYFLKTLIKIIVFIVLFIQPVFIYMTFYNPGDQDDKAVHYYSSAFFYASAYKKNIIMQSIPAWVEKADSVWMKQRIIGRVTSASNYIAADILIKSVRDWYCRTSQSGIKDPPYAKYIKISFVLMLIIAMGYLIFLSARSLFGVWPMLLILNLAAFWLIKIIPPPPLNVDTFRGYYPRCSANLLILAILLSYAGKKKAYFIISCLLLLCWHAGLAILTLFIIFIVFFAIDVITRLLANKSSAVKISLSPPFYLIFTFLLLVFLLITVRSALYGIPILGQAAGLLTPKALFLMALKFAILIGMLCLFIKAKIIDWKDEFCSRFFLGITGFLIVAKILSTFVRYAPLRSLMSFTKLYLMYESPIRLLGIRYLLTITLLVFIAWCLWKRLQASVFMRKKVLQKIRLFSFFFAMVLLLTVVYHYKEMYSSIYRRKAAYFSETFYDNKKIPLQEDNLFKLDPSVEPQFFYSLGEFLFDDKSNCK